MASLLRQAFDAVERPIAAAAESWVETETFMDFATVAVKVQRRLGGDAQRATEQWLRAWGLASRADITKLMNEVGSLTREVRDLRQQVARREAGVRLRQAPDRKAA
jgi:hypothetical protein